MDKVESSIDYLKFAPKFVSQFSEKETREMLQIPNSWHHSFEFGNIQTTNIRTSLNYQMWASQGLPLDLTGKSVLDIGTSDGFYSFLCEERGAKRVLATDSQRHEGVPSLEDESHARFEIIKKILNSNVEYKKLDVYDVDTLDETFDIVLFFGVYYHLKDPILAIKKLSDITNENMFLAGHSLDTSEPLMYFYKPKRKDRSNFAQVVASPESLMSVGEKYGFREVKTLDVMDMQMYENYPHMIFGDKTMKVLTMNFIK
jgi:tRNA (mo5U34)-methyltransferase